MNEKLDGSSNQSPVSRPRNYFQTFSRNLWAKLIEYTAPRITASHHKTVL